MSETKLVSPLLDDFTLGAPISNHSGICCCPAMREGDQTKYIVKVIAVPASQVQLDALLVTGAYRDPAAALDYFRRQAERISEEAALLEKLSRLDGFLSYDGCQVTPMRKNRLGYHIYLLSEYHHSLEKHIRRHPITRQEAVNIGLDLCSALTMCRQAGYIYADLKPTNVYVGDDQVCRISDLGFVELTSLPYTSLPDKYISPYAAPETKDAMCTLNDTVDTYALGMILYRIFNGGKLPELPEDPAQALPAPEQADEQMAQIILKACAPKIEDRWHDPAELGQALVAYMQSTADLDQSAETPIIEAVQAAAEETVRFDPAAFSETAEETPAVTSAETIQISIPDIEEAQAEETAPPAEEPQPEETAETPDVEAAAVSEEVQPEVEEVVPMDRDIANIISSLDEPKDEEPAPAQEAPEASEEAPFDLGNALDEVSTLINEPKPVRKSAVKTIEPTPVVMGKKRRGGAKRFLVTLLVLVILAAAGFCGYCFYEFIYTQSIDAISVSGTQSQMTVSLKTAADDSLLTVTCSDVFGNRQQQSVKNGQAVFTDLLPDSLYKISVEISGLHKLVGSTNDVFTTESQTEVISFTAVTGQEDGSVLLAMTVHGHEPDQWTVTCSGEEEQDIVQNFSGHSVTVKGLTVGKTYTFTLSTEGIDLMGDTSLEFTASSVISASNLTPVSRIGGDLTVCWDAPKSHTVDSWLVHCYGENYDATKTVTGTLAAFTDTQDNVEYTIEVTAAGMTQPTRTVVTANSITITSLNIDDSTPQELRLNWEFEGPAPEGGWLLSYTMDGSEYSNAVKCTAPNALIAPRVPGAQYHFTVQTLDGGTVFNGIQSYQCPPGAPYDGHSISADMITARLLETPSDSDWLVDNLSASDYKDRFTNVQKISIALEAGVRFFLDNEDINILFVIRDRNGKVIPNLIEQVRYDWHDLWVNGNPQTAELALPNTPPLTGSYQVDIYFNGYMAATANFIIA